MQQVAVAISQVPVGGRLGDTYRTGDPKTPRDTNTLESEGRAKQGLEAELVENL